LVHDDDSPRQAARRMDGVLRHIPTFIIFATGGSNGDLLAHVGVPQLWICKQLSNLNCHPRIMGRSSRQLSPIVTKQTSLGYPAPEEGKYIIELRRSATMRVLRISDR
jgi:hypothetical protein